MKINKKDILYTGENSKNESRFLIGNDEDQKKVANVFQVLQELRRQKPVPSKTMSFSNERKINVLQKLGKLR